MDSEFWRWYAIFSAETQQRSKKLALLSKELVGVATLEWRACSDSHSFW